MNINNNQNKIDIAEDILGHNFKDKEVIERALTHPSAALDSKKDSYERMEFLGDSLLGAFVAQDLYERFPDADEGLMTKMKISVVSGEFLSKVASDIGLDEAIVFGKSEFETGKRGMHSALGNVIESMVAALALDAGIDVAHEWVTCLLSPYYSPEHKPTNGQHKSALQEYLQARKKTPVYELMSYEGPPHNREFKSKVSCEDKVLGIGIGKTKKESENMAARLALEALKK